MRVFHDVVAVGLVGAVLMAGPARAASAAPQTTAATTKVDDRAIQSRIAADLKKNASLATRAIDVDVKQGVVTLTGTVRTAAEKARAERLAKVRGVTRVDNRIEVDSKIDQSKIDTAAEKTKAGVTKGGRQRERGREGQRRGAEGRGESGTRCGESRRQDVGRRRQGRRQTGRHLDHHPRQSRLLRREALTEHGD